MNKLSFLSRAHRKRYREVISIISKYGLDELISSSQFQDLPLVKRIKPRDAEILKLSRWVRVRLAIEELGGAYIKVGQILSNRPDLIPEELITELEKLQDGAPPFSSREALKIIRKELGQPLKDLFLMFDEEPLATASIAQVHRAILLDTTPVVVKVQRPNIEEQFKIDLDVLIFISQQLIKTTPLKEQFKKHNPLKDLRKEIEKELDFQNEAQNIIRFSNNFINDERVHVPTVYTPYSSRYILTMEYIEGNKVTDIKKLEHAGLDVKLIADKLVDVGLKQIIEHHFFHGDPHPGNINILDDGTICFLDFGLMGRLTSRQYQTIIDLITAFSQHDSRKLSRIMSKSIPAEKYVDTEKLENEIALLMDDYYDLSLENINVGELLTDVMGFLGKYDIALPPNIYLLMKSLSSYEGVALKLNPKFEIAPYAKKYARKIMREKLSPKNIAKDLYLTSSDTIALFRDFPGEVRNLLHLLQAGRLTVNANVLELRETVDYVFYKVNQTINRVVYAILLAAVILGTSLILRGTEGGVVLGVPVFAGLGFLISIVMAILLLISIFRSRTF
jgi:ubiquinone biosynthesis protein